MSDSLWPHGLQHTRPPCPSPTPRVYSNSRSLRRWCHPTISSSVVPFSSHLQSFPASRSFQMSQFFPSGGQSIGVSASASASSFILILPYFPKAPEVRQEPRRNCSLLLWGSKATTHFLGSTNPWEVGVITSLQREGRATGEVDQKEEEFSTFFPARH